MNIQIISASAGSGKTYTLAELLEEEIRGGRVRPAAVLATTFTRKAAAELEERVRTRLLSQGLGAEAQQLAASRIGTVNSVCGRLLADFAFELGISPVQNVLYEEAAGEALLQAMARVVSPAKQKRLVDLQRVMEDKNGHSAVADIVSKARVNGLAVGDLQESARRSIATFKALLGSGGASDARLEAALKVGLDQFLRHVDTDHDTTAATRKTVQLARATQAKLHNRERISWATWLRLARLAPGRKSLGAAKHLITAAAGQDVHPGLIRDCTALISLVFELAAETLDAYQEYKREWGVVDFIDQEVLTLQLLSLPAVQSQLREELDLVLVDEFQDTSPIQIAIFLKLAGLARQSVWVGDQKQAIYGFRDADPALMDAAIAGILGVREPRTLDKSWRSRPSLVQSTSDIFVRAFSIQDYPENRVRLVAAVNEEPSELNAIYECWQLESTNQANDALALAAVTRQFLDDPDNKIRDPQTGIPRRARGGDLAILCRTNSVCAAVAAALEQQEIPAALPRSGLMATPEAILAVAGLRFMADPGDSLARAEIARLTQEPQNPDAWLAEALRQPHAGAFHPRVTDAIDKTREANALKGPLNLLDRAMTLTDVRTYCLKWGRSSDRLANLDSLRKHAVNYVDECSARGMGASAAGLITFLNLLEEDTRAVVRGLDAVTVLTWHGAKGLEWPVTVLFQLEKTYKGRPLGVNVVSDRVQFDLSDPLADRWIRYWPYPYGGLGVGAPFHDRLAAHKATSAATEREERQELRLLYVGWTRARDKVVLAGRKGFLQKGILRLLKGEDGQHLLEAPGRTTVWAGCEIEVVVRKSAPRDPVPVTFQPDSGYAVPGEKSHPPAFLAASAVEQKGTVGEIIDLGPRLPLTGDPDKRPLGEAVHGFLAAEVNFVQDKETRTALAEQILARWSLIAHFAPDSLVTAADRLRHWIAVKWPGARCRYELPAAWRQTSGTIISGVIDLLIEIEDGCIIIDHKSFHGDLKQAEFKAASFAGQLWAYGEVVKNATGKDLCAAYIHFPITGKVMEVMINRHRV